MNNLQVNSGREFPKLNSNERLDIYENLEKNCLSCCIIPKKESYNPTALETLSRIEKWIQKEQYMNQWNHLTTIFTTIVERYTQKFEGRCAFTKIFYKEDFLALKAKETLLKNMIEIRRKNKESPPILFPVVDDVIQHICSYLPYKALANLSAVNRTAKKCVNVFFLLEAFRLNYKGAKDDASTKKYLKSILHVTENLIKSGFISDEFCYFKDNGQVDIEKTLMNWKKKKLFPCQDLRQLPVDGNKPFYRYRHFGIDSEIAQQVLLDSGMDPNLTDGDGNTMLHLTHDDDAMSALLKGGANPNIKNYQGFPPLAMQLRIYKNQKEINLSIINVVKVLLENQADANYQNPDDGNTLHHDAIEITLAGKPMFITATVRRLLLEYSSEGVDKKKNHAGQTPDQLYKKAIQLEHQRIAASDREREWRNHVNSYKAPSFTGLYTL